MNRLKVWLQWFVGGNGTGARFLRTVVQGVLSAVVVAMGTGDWGATFATAALMAVISPIMAVLDRSGVGFEDDAANEGEE